MNRNRIMAWALGLFAALLVIMLGKGCVSTMDAPKKKQKATESSQEEGYEIIKPTLDPSLTAPPPTEQQYDQFGRPIYGNTKQTDQNTEPATDENGTAVETEPATDEFGNVVGLSDDAENDVNISDLVMTEDPTEEAESSTAEIEENTASPDDTEETEDEAPTKAKTNRPPNGNGFISGFGEQPTEAPTQAATEETSINGYHENNNENATLPSDFVLVLDF